MIETFGKLRLFNDLKKLGFDSYELTDSTGLDYAVIHKYCIPSGNFSGRVIKLAIPAPKDYPLTICSSIHIKANPQLIEISNVPNKRNVIKSNLGPEWRYWSHSFNLKDRKTTRRLLSLIQRVFDEA